jgi:hypothetical protein
VAEAIDSESSSASEGTGVSAPDELATVSPAVAEAIDSESSSAPEGTDVSTGLQVFPDDDAVEAQNMCRDGPSLVSQGP